MDIEVNEIAIKKMVHDYIEREQTNDIIKITGRKTILPFNIKKYSILKGGVSVDYEIIINDKRILSEEKSFHNSVLFGYDTYKSYLRNQKLRSLNVTLADKIKPNIDSYLEFDSDELFMPGSLVRIFGGAIRDSISGKDIHDVDILVGSRSLSYIENVLKNHGYSYIEQLVPKDLSSIYTDIKIISEPHSWVKGKKVVQIIRTVNLGVSGDMPFTKSYNLYIESFRDLIRNVDISCCGVSYDAENVYENYQDAINHCRSGIFKVNKDAKMFSPKRIEHRKVKLKGRGWQEIYSDKIIERDIKIEKILNKEDLDYVPEWKSGLYYGNKLPDDNFDDIWSI
jgi:hypothetical protein